MKSYKELGYYIEPRNERNVDARYGVNELRGVNSEGKICDSRANIVGVEFNTYKIAHKGDFIYNPARLDIGSISCLEEDLCIVSQMYVVFRVKKECQEQLLTEYLWLWFKRPEFFRYVGFINFGSVREMFTYEDMCNVTLPVPSITEQRRIVNEYQTVERRIKNNEALIQKLEETAQAIYHHTFVEGIDENNLPEGWRMGCLGDICEFSNGKLIEPTSGNIPIYGGNGIIGYTDEYNANNVIVIGRVGVNCGCLYLEEDSCWVNDNAMKGTSINGCILFAYYHMDALKLNRYSGGSSQPLVTQALLNQIPCVLPDKQTIKRFDEKVKVLRMNQKLITKELHHLRTLQSLLTSKLA